MSYRAGDGFLTQAPGRSNQQAVFLDSTGRSYSLPAHSLPSARGQGEPLTGRLSPPPGAEFVSVLLPEDQQLYLLASDAGYGFVVQGADLQSRNKNGKALLSLPEGGRVLAPLAVSSLDSDQVVAISNEGRLLVFPLKDLPQLSKGKGNKILSIPSARVKSREEFVVGLAILPEGASLVLTAGKRTLTLKPSDLEHYRGERGRRGNKLPRGFQKVDAVQVEG